MACAICEQPLVDTEEEGEEVQGFSTLECGHLYHNACLNEFSRSGALMCPECKREMWQYFSSLSLMGWFWLAVTLVQMVMFLAILAYSFLLTLMLIMAIVVFSYRYPSNTLSLMMGLSALRRWRR